MLFKRIRESSGIIQAEADGWIIIKKAKTKVTTGIVLMWLMGKQ